MGTREIADMSFPEHLRYGPQHEWTDVAADRTVTVGITDFAQDQLGDIQWIELPSVGAEVERASAFVEVESTKTASDVYAPCSGTVLAVNESLINAPEQVNADPYAAWFVRIEPTDPGELNQLIDATAYRRHVAGE